VGWWAGEEASGRDEEFMSSRRRDMWGRQVEDWMRTSRGRFHSWAVLVMGKCEYRGQARHLV
jgi:hypothetical protein